MTKKRLPLSAVVKDDHDCIQAFVFPFDLYVDTRNIGVGIDVTNSNQLNPHASNPFIFSGVS